MTPLVMTRTGSLGLQMQASACGAGSIMPNLLGSAWNKKFPQVWPWQAEGWPTQLPTEEKQIFPANRQRFWMKGSEEAWDGASTPGLDGFWLLELACLRIQTGVDTICDGGIGTQAVVT